MSINILPNHLIFHITNKDSNGHWINITKYLEQLSLKISSRFGGAYQDNGIGFYINNNKELINENTFRIIVSFGDEAIPIVYDLLTNFIIDLSFELQQETVSFYLNSKLCLIELGTITDYKFLKNEIIKTINLILFGTEVIHIKSQDKTKFDKNQQLNIKMEVFKE